MRRWAILAATVLMLLAGCTASSGRPNASGHAASSAPADTSGSVAASKSASASQSAGAAGLHVVSTVASGLSAPWGLAFLPDGAALLSERDSGDIVKIAAGTTSNGSLAPVGTVPGVVPGGEAGLLGLAVAPTFEADRWLYAYLTTAEDNRIVRMQLGAGDVGLGPPQVLVQGIAKAANHDGGRLVFGPDGKLYAGVGDAGDRPNAQVPTSLNGKILRINPDGTPPADNPDPTSLVYSAGHRNVQGLAFDSTGRLWASEFGQDTWDELNIITAGGNYGWPTVEGIAHQAGFIDPVAQWATKDASPSGLAIVGDDVLMAALRGERLWIIPMEGISATSGGGAGTPVAALIGEYGRLRTVAQAPDGSVWLITSNTDGRGDPAKDDDRILRLTD
jgi:glucose/arabinose dehydrogenase